jgi:hypothetical protein
MGPDSNDSGDFSLDVLSGPEHVTFAIAFPLSVENRAF